MTLLREGVVRGMWRSTKRKRKKRKRRKRKKVLEDQGKQQTRVAPWEEWERVKGTLLGREWEAETEQWHLRMERGSAEEMHQKRDWGEGQLEGGEAVEWQQLTQEGRGEGKKALWGSREEVAEPKTAVERVMMGQLQVGTQQWGLSNSSQDQVQDLAVYLGIYKDLGSWSPRVWFP